MIKIKLKHILKLPSVIFGIITNQYYFLPKSRVTYSHDLLYTFHNADFLKDNKFIESYKLGKATDNGHLLDGYDIEWRIHVLCWAAQHAIRIGGDFVECGVHTGIGSRAVTNFVDFEKQNATFYLLDTFEGLDSKYSTIKEMERNKKMGYDKRGDIYDQVKETFKKYQNVKIIKGVVPETLAQVGSELISYLSLDMNCVGPEIDALEYFWPKMKSGGIIILDDYGYANSTNDQKEAHDKFAASKGVTILSLPTCQGIIIKP